MKTQAPLDRLSALLEGMAPRVRVLHADSASAADGRLEFGRLAGPCLYLHLLTQGRVCLHAGGLPELAVQDAGILVCRGDLPHRLVPVSMASGTTLLSARACLEGPVAELMLAEFAEPMAISLQETDASLRHVLQLINAELLDPRCGQPALLDRAGDILFIGLLRHLVAHPRKLPGLLSALSDPRIARALVAVHQAPEQNWTLETLAAEAGMSRTAFAVRFRDMMDCPPGRYLAAVRLAIARRWVQAGRGLKQAARASGYGSPAALSRALARHADPAAR